MNPFLDDPDFTLYVGDALTVLSELPDESVHCVVTSPPYFGLRDYGTGTWDGGDESCDHIDKSKVLGNVRRNLAEAANRSDGGQRVAENRRDHDGDQYGTFRDVCGECGAVRVDHQVGLEATPFDFVDRMVVIFREVRRVLRSDGVCWLNLGDSYVGALSQHRDGSAGKTSVISKKTMSGIPSTGRVERGIAQREAGLKPKDLMGIPWRVALALQDDGWWLRSDCIWSKPSTMPESVTDRPTRSHEYLFLLTKSGRYFYDMEAIREPDAGLPMGNKNGFVGRQGGSADHIPVGGGGGSKERWLPGGGRNKRTVWEVSIQPFKDAHFAVFPEKLIEPCVLAGTSEHGCCPECGAPWERVTEGGEGTYEDRKALGFGGAQNMKYGEHPGNHRQARPSHIELTPAAKQTVGWDPTCKCDAAPVPCTVLDPFMGSGTTALVSRRLGRKSIGIELNPTYAAMAAKRLSQQSLFA